MCVINRTVRLIVCALFAAFVVAGVGMSAANAQQPTPAQLLQQYPNGGLPFVNAIKQLVRSDTSKFSEFISLVGIANDRQKADLGGALTELAKEEVLIDQALAIRWQAQIAAINDPIFKTAALDALGDVQLGAVGGAPGGDFNAALGGPLEGSGGGGGGLEEIRSTPVETPFFSYTSAVFGTGGSITINSEFNSSTNNPVSPSRF
jgi:hypothetical protein